MSFPSLYNCHLQGYFLWLRNWTEMDLSSFSKVYSMEYSILSTSCWKEESLHISIEDAIKKYLICGCLLPPFWPSLPPFWPSLPHGQVAIIKIPTLHIYMQYKLYIYLAFCCWLHSKNQWVAFCVTSNEACLLFVLLYVKWKPVFSHMETWSYKRPFIHPHNAISAYSDSPTKKSLVIFSYILVQFTIKKSNSKCI